MIHEVICNAFLAIRENILKNILGSANSGPFQLIMYLNNDGELNAYKLP